MTCTHEIWEKDTAANFDGLCPICLKDALEAKDAEIKALNMTISDLRKYWREQRAALEEKDKELAALRSIMKLD
jgi:hypothetical protein